MHTLSFFCSRAGALRSARLLVLLACGATALRAQTVPTAPPAPAGDTVPLDRIVVKGQALRGANAPFSVDSLALERIRDQRVSHPEELFREVAGMNVRNFGLSGVADTIVLRGFGGGGHGSELGMVIDGIPLNEAMSHADGYADLNVVIPLEIETMNVFKGPVSALYGNYNRSGLIALETRKAGTYGNTDVSVATNDTVDAQLALGLAPAPGQQINLAAQHYRTDGFRPQSAFDRTTLAGRWGATVSPALQFSLSARFYTGDGDSASYLPRPQFERDPYGIDPRVQNDGSEKEYLNLRADGSARLSPELKLLAFAYNTRQTFTRWYTRPVSTTTWAQREEGYEREVWGGGLNLNGQRRLAAGTLNWVGGIETFRESTDYVFADGLNNRRRVAPLIYDRTADLDSTSLFGEVEAPLHAFFKPWFAARHDRFSGSAVRRGPETGTDPLGPLNKTHHTSPKLGVRSDVAPGVQLRASWAEGFALASNFVKYSAGAANVDPNTFRQSEAGAAFRVIRGLRLDVAAYRIVSSGEILQVSPGVFQNFGRTRRTGVEAKAEWRPLEPLLVSAAYGTAASRIERNPSAALVGRKVTGVPDRTGTFGFAWSPRDGWGAGATLRHVGSCAVDATNTLYSPTYTTLDLAVSYRGQFEGRRYRAYVSVDNATDRKYATSVSLSNGFQILAPGAPLTPKVGVQFDF
jgi:outer membrane receptor protein involved in Fe transport